MDKPKILIALYAYYPFANANTNAMLSYIAELKKVYDVFIVTQNNTNKARRQEIIDDITVIRYRKPSGLRKLVYWSHSIEKNKQRIWYKQITVMACKILFDPLYTFLKQPEYKEIERLLKKYSFKFVLSTCALFTSHLNMLKLRKRKKVTIPWFAYFMDPYAYYIGNRHKTGLIKQEREIYQNADIIFVTEEIYIENKSNENALFLAKTIPIKFGNFSLAKYPLIEDIFEKGKINCVYVGSLFDEEIRSPEYFYRIINNLDDRFCVHMVCNNLSRGIMDLRDRVLNNSSIVRWYNSLPLEICKGIISNADILVNLANRLENQTPSKVFDYIGAGKPIINLFSLEKDTSKRYLEQYPVKLNLREDDSLLLDNVEKFKSFCVENKGKTIDTEVILERYADYLPENTGPQMLKCILDYFGEK